MDGVLVDSGRVASGGMGGAARRAGRRARAARLLAAHHRPAQRGGGAARSSGAPRARPRGVSPRPAQARPLRRTLARGALRAVPGAPAFVADLARRGVPRAVGTSASQLGRGRYPRARSGSAGTSTVVVTADDVSFGKPDPEVYVLAARRLGMPTRRLHRLRGLGGRASQAARARGHARHRRGHRLRRGGAAGGGRRAGRSTTSRDSSGTRSQAGKRRRHSGRGSTPSGEDGWELRRRRPAAGRLARRGRPLRAAATPAPRAWRSGLRARATTRGCSRGRAIASSASTSRRPPSPRRARSPPPRASRVALRAARHLHARRRLRRRLRRGVGVHVLLRHRPRAPRGVRARSCTPSSGRAATLLGCFYPLREGADGPPFPVSLAEVERLLAPGFRVAESRRARRVRRAAGAGWSGCLRATRGSSAPAPRRSRRPARGWRRRAAGPTARSPNQSRPMTTDSTMEISRAATT